MKIFTPLSSLTSEAAITLAASVLLPSFFMISLLLTPSFVFAESAPVYDADALSQDDGYADYSPNYNPNSAHNSNLNNDVYDPATRETAPSQARPAEVLSPEQRLKRVEQQITNLQASESNARLESLQTQIQTLQANVDQLTHEVQLLKTQQPTQMVEPSPSHKLAKPALETATSKLIQTKQVTKVVGPHATKTIETTKTTEVSQPNTAEEQQIYQTAYNFIKAKKYDEAVNTLQGMLKKYPAGQFASNAHYWLGELYGLLNKHDLALVQFNSVIKNYPDSPRVADAQLKIGLIYAAQLKWNDAKTAFKKVTSDYPGTATARLATQQLKQIKQAGH